MKKITFIIVMAFAAINLSAVDQLKIADFESGSNYFTKVSAGFVTIEIVDNPDDSSINPSAKVLKFTYTSGYPNYAVAVKQSGVDVALPLPIGNVEEIVTGSYRYAHLMLYKPFKSKLLLTLQKPGIPDGQTPQYLNQKINEWEDVVIDLLSGTTYMVQSDTNYDIFQMQFDYSGRTPASTAGFDVYIDDIYLRNDVSTDISTGKFSDMGVIVVRSKDGSTLVNVSNANKKSLKLEVFNIQGRFVKTVFAGQSISGAYAIGSLPQGNYILKVTTSDKIQNIKF